MKEMTLSERLFNNVNTAFSINFMVLQNIAKLLPNGKQTVFTSSDVFRQRTYKEETYDLNFHRFAEIRNDFFKSIEDEFEAEQILQEFQNNCTALIFAYNKTSKQQIKVSDVFSDRNIINWELFSELFEIVSPDTPQTSQDSINFQFTLAQFANFYDVYKDWVSAYDIFQTLKDDISDFGSRTAYLGKPQHPDVFVLDFEMYHNFSSKVARFIQERTKKLKIVSKSKEQENPETALYLQESERSINSIIDMFNRIQDRFGFANTHLMELDSFLTKLAYKITYLKDDFKIEKVYIHRNEILSLISAMTTFPELDEYSNLISNTFFGKNVNFSKISTKENT